MISWDAPLFLDLLTVAAGAPQGDIAAWVDAVALVWGRHDGDVLERGCAELVDRGFMTTAGGVRDGWLTDAGRAALTRAQQHHQPPAPATPLIAQPTLDQFRRETKRTYWHSALLHTKGNVAKAARIAGLSKRVAYRQLQDLNIAWRDYRPW